MQCSLNWSHCSSSLGWLVIIDFIESAAAMATTTAANIARGRSTEPAWLWWWFGGSPIAIFSRWVLMQVTSKRYHHLLHYYFHRSACHFQLLNQIISTLIYLPSRRLQPLFCSWEPHYYFLDDNPKITEPIKRSSFRLSARLAILKTVLFRLFNMTSIN